MAEIRKNRIIHSPFLASDKISSVDEFGVLDELESLKSEIPNRKPKIVCFVVKVSKKSWIH